MTRNGVILVLKGHYSLKNREKSLSIHPAQLIVQGECFIEKRLVQRKNQPFGVENIQ